MQKYTKINTMYKRYVFQGLECPNEKWKRFKNQIILGEFSDKVAEYLFNNEWEAYSKIDGTNCKIAYFPSSKKICVEGKDENSQNQRGCFEYLESIANRIKPMLEEMFPPSCARFIQTKDKETKQTVYYNADDTSITEPISNEGKYIVNLEEAPIYIYGEYYGNGIQKCGKQYIANGNDFVVFDINQQGWWLPKNLRDEICQKLNLPQVPFLGYMTLADVEKMVRKGFTTKLENVSNPTLIEEGIVCRPTVPLFYNSSNRVITKVKYCDYVKYDKARQEFTDEEFNEFNEWYHQNTLQP